jgi:L-iditol 2-dehydrogenase
MLLRRTGARIYATDTMTTRRALAVRFGAQAAYDPTDSGMLANIAEHTDGRGADVVIVAASAKCIVEQAIRCSRPGSRILLFSQTSHQERIEVSGADICMGERSLLGSYSASVDLQRESAELVFSGELPVEKLISHRLPLDRISDGFQMALHPDDNSLKIMVQPQRWS